MLSGMLLLFHVHGECSIKEFANKESQVRFHMLDSNEEFARF